MLGIFLIPFYKVPNKWVLGISAILFFGVARFLIFYLTGGDALFSELDINPDNPKILNYYNTIKNGSLGEVFAANATEGHIDKAEFQYGLFGRGYFTFAFFLVGLFVGRSGFFKRIHEEKKLTKKFLIYSSIALVIALVVMAAAFMSMGENFNIKSLPAMIGFAGMDISNTAMTLVYIALFVIVYRKAKGQKLLDKFVPYGRMALTNYVAQSIVFTFILFGWGLGFIGELRQLYTFLLSLVFIAVQMWLSKIWLKYFYYGPLEWLWRSLTFFKLMPLQRKK